MIQSLPSGSRHYVSNHLTTDTSLKTRSPVSGPSHRVLQIGTRPQNWEAEMGDKPGEGQSGGVNISGTVGTAGGDIVGRDKIVGAPSPAALDRAPLVEAISAAPADKRTEAEAKLAALKQEAAKGEKANDRTVADLVDGLVKLVPGAVSAFATPILGGIAGPVTGFVLDKL